MLSGFLGEDNFFNGVHVSFNIRSYSEVFDKVGILKTFAKFTAKRQYHSLFYLIEPRAIYRMSFLQKQVLSWFSDIFNNT